MHGIPDGSERVDLFDLDSERIWPEKDGVIIMGTPLGSSLFVSSYLPSKEVKHRLLLQFIQDVAAAGYPREAEHMLKEAVVSRLSHILRSVQKNQNSIGWMPSLSATLVPRLPGP